MKTDLVYEVDLPAYIDAIGDIGDTADYTEEMDWWNMILSDRDQKSFAVSGVPDGDGWPQWELQEKWRFDKGDHDTLVASGRLMKSLQRNSSEGVDEVSKRDSWFGTTVPYARIHQTGGQAELEVDLYDREGVPKVDKDEQDKVNIPQRPFATMTLQMVDGLADVVALSLIEQMKKG